MAKIFAARALAFADRLGALLRFLQDFCRERVRQVVLADDDFGVDAKITRAAQDFDDPTGRRGATSGIAG